MLKNKKIYINSSEDERLKKIAEYWEDKNTRSLIDKNLKTLEIQTITKSLKKNDIVIDIGCGDGQSACECSKYVKKIIGIDNSSTMINKANDFSQGKFSNVVFQRKNILDLRDIKQKFDVAVTDRVITNLPTWKIQKNVILAIKSILKKNGRYIMIENFTDGYEKMNKYRESMGLEAISKHWHNTYLEKKKLIHFLKNHFKIIEEYNFNLYYFLTRIYTPMYASFTGFGKNAKSDEIFKHSDDAARQITEKLSSELKFLENQFLGPINGLLLVKK